jgi:hypothetical protein
MTFHRYTKEYEELQTRFIADLMQASVAAPTDEQQLSAARKYLTSLQPWLTAEDAALPFRAEFSLFDQIDLERKGKEVEGAHVRLSPETERFFHAWLRKQGVDVSTT